VIVIRDCKPERFGRLVETAIVSFFTENSISIVVVGQHRNRLKVVRMTIAAVALPMFAAPYVIPVPLDIARHHQVEPSIAIQANPGC
jgi:hypothetical protein